MDTILHAAERWKLQGDAVQVVFTGGGVHDGWLTAEELRLLAEWIDLGAQLYNDPFRVPEN